MDRLRSRSRPSSATVISGSRSPTTAAVSLPSSCRGSSSASHGSGPSQERSEGAGLGLAIAKSYAQAHGGDLLYEPMSPHGAQFRFVLPTQANG